MVKYNLFLSGVDNEDNVSTERVIAYAKNRVMANMGECIKDEIAPVYQHLTEVLVDINAIEQDHCFDEEIIKDLSFYIIEEGSLDELDDETIAVILSIKENIGIKALRKAFYRSVDENTLSKMGLAEAGSIISVFGEEVEASKDVLDKFVIGDDYVYSKIETLIEELNLPLSVYTDDETDVFSIEEVGEGTLGNTLYIIKECSSPDTVVSFVLSGATGNGYIVRCVYKA